MAVWTVSADPDNGLRGRVTGALFDAPCALGKGGMVAAASKTEGDGATPQGSYPLRRVFYRPDRVEAPLTALPVEALSPELGWCDDVTSPHYNRLVRLPFGEGHEKMWRDDGLYDVVLVIGHNDAPVVKGHGSAIFVHVARAGFTPTLGCVALAQDQLLRLLRMVKPADIFKII